MCAPACTAGSIVRQDVPGVDETILLARRSRPETNPCNDNRNNGEAIMLPIILNAIYLQFLHAVLPGISSQGAKS